ncbi:MAG: ABC transporter substrate-binding protein [Flavobacteriales bacterium]|nr:ABC transporter substrate-binding protein [Flavobacteriales bacterium]
MKKLFYYTFVIVVVIGLQACNDEGSTQKNEVQQQDVNTGQDNILDFIAQEKYQTLDPTKVLDLTSAQVLSQINECLVRFDEDNLSIKPMLASFWEVDPSGLSYTFHLNKEVFFHDNACFEGGKGRVFNASDVVFTFKRICSPSEGNYGYSLFKELIVGAQDYYEGKQTKFGVEAIDAYTVKFNIIKPSSNFLQLLGSIFSAIVSEEAINSNQIVGTGPFIYTKENDTETSITLLRNSNYHLKEKGVQLPYLEGVRYNYGVDGRGVLEAFKNNKIDILENIPVDEINSLVEDNISDFQNEPVKYILARNKELAITFINFNTSVAPFNNLKVRKAIAMAIDKNRIVDKVLKGEAYGPANHGLVPPAIKDYDYTSVVGLEFDVAKAKKLLADAGFKNGEGFPKTEIITSKQNINVRVALELQKQLKANLGINVEITSTSLAELIAIRGGKTSNIILSSWIAETPDPTNFLSLLYGGFVNSSIDESSYPNDSRFNNEAYDKAYKEAIITIDKEKKYELCLIADQIAANEVPIVPLWYFEKYQLIQSYVLNYKPNAMRIHYLPFVKIDYNAVKKKIETH